jgi:Cof subfamily protein (haloacid dehalogenase superfamily)
MTAMADRARPSRRESPAGGQRFRLVVLDIDGTLLDPEGQVAPRVRDAVRAASASGCIVTLASGRRLWAVRPIVEALGIDAPVILYNGALVYDVGSETAVLGACLEPLALRGALDVIWNCGFQPVVYGHPGGGELVYTGPASRDAPATTHYFDRPTVQPLRRDLTALYAVPNPPLLAAMGEEDEVRQLQAALTAARIGCQTLVERQSFVPRSRWWQVDVSSPGCSKGEALHRLCERFGVPVAATLAIGDGINDVDLVREAGLGVAMGNAVPEVKTAAGVVVADNAHDGAAEALERYVLNTERERAPLR